MSAQLDSRTNNFDFIRLFLAVLVIFSHSFPLTGEPANELFLRATRGQLTGGQIAVDAFFIISGYLITASFEHSRSLWIYLKKRIFRIFPAFIVLTLFDLAVVLPMSAGHLAGTSPVRNCLMVLGKTLSLDGFATIGAFRFNPYPEAINGSLWTIRVEFMCYIGLALIGVCGFLRNRHWTLCLLGVWLALTTIIAHSGLSPYRADFPYPAHSGLWGFLLRLVPCYLAGVVVYLYRKSIGLNLLSVAVAGAVLVGACFVPLGLLTAIPLAGSYLLVTAAYSPVIRLHHFARFGDFSYGTYLYAFPVQQMLVRYGRASMSPMLLFLMATPITAVLAAASWHLIEKRFLSRSRVLH